jgi:hypothetical protein
MAFYLSVSSIIFGMKRVKHYPEQRQIRHPNAFVATTVLARPAVPTALGAERINVI